MEHARTIAKALELAQCVYFELCDLIDAGASPRIAAALEEQKRVLLEIEMRLEEVV